MGETLSYQNFLLIKVTAPVADLFMDILFYLVEMLHFDNKSVLPIRLRMKP